MIMEYGGIAYTDESPTSFFGAGWKDAKESAPYSQLPLLVVDGGAPIAQSGSICRYVASLVPGLVPSDPVEAARCDAVFEAAQELMAINPIVNVFKAEQFHAKKKEYFDVFPSKCANLAKVLGSQTFFFGAKPTYCDFNVFHALDNVRSVEPDSLACHPNLVAFMRAFEGLPGVSAYLADRPKPVAIGEAPMLEPNFVGRRAVGYPK